MFEVEAVIERSRDRPSGVHTGRERPDAAGRPRLCKRCAALARQRIFCDFCVEACPKDAITDGYNFELSVYNRADLLKRKEDLLTTKQVQSKNYRLAFSDEDVDSEYKVI